MTRAIASLDGYGRDNTLIQALAKLSSHSNWTSEDIQRRQLKLVELSRSVWLMDMAETGAI